MKVVQLPQLREISPLGDLFSHQQPCSIRARMGQELTSLPILADTCSNTTLIDKNLFYKLFPKTKVSTYTRTRVTGVGSKNTQGFALVPIDLELADPAAHSAE